MTQYHPEVPMTDTQTHPIVPMTEIPRGAPGRPLAEGHLEAHHLLVDAVEELKASNQALTNDVQQLQAANATLNSDIQQLQASNTLLTDEVADLSLLVAGGISGISTSFPVTVNPGDIWRPTGISQLLWTSGGVGIGSQNNEDGVLVPTPGFYIGQLILNFGVSGITALTTLRVSHVLQTYVGAVPWDGWYAWYLNAVLYELQPGTTQLHIIEMGRAKNPSITGLNVLSLSTNTTPMTLTGFSIAVMRLNSTFVPNA